MVIRDNEKLLLEVCLAHVLTVGVPSVGLSLLVISKEEPGEERQFLFLHSSPHPTNSSFLLVISKVGENEQ